MKTGLLRALLMSMLDPKSAEDSPAFTDEKIVRTANVAAGRDATWSAWTRADELPKWFGREALVDPVPGGAYEIFFMMDQPPGQRGGEGNKVQAVLPGRTLAFIPAAPNIQTLTTDFTDEHG